MPYKLKVPMMIMVLLLGGISAEQQEQSIELEDYPTAGSEDIYFFPNDIEEEYFEEQIDNEVNPNDNDIDNGASVEQTSNNIEAIGENESSCEYSCPRYYRPLCVRRNDQLITYATPCEYFNQLRCANVARNQGKQDTPTFEVLYNEACKEN